MKTYYQVVRFSPDPEVVEPVNVALFVAGDRNSLVYDETFPKLSCVAPKFDRGLLDLYLRHLSTAVEDAGGEGARLISSASSQFSLTGPREILTSNINAFLQTLVDRYLARAGSKRGDQSKAPQIQSRLEELLVSKFGIPGDSLCKQAPPRDYLTTQVRQHLAAEDFKFARVLSASKHLVAMDAIDPEAPRADLERRALRIGYGFHQLGKVKAILEEAEGRKLYRAAIILGSSAKIPDTHLEFAKDTLQSRAEVVFDATIPSPEFLAITKAAVASMSLVGFDRLH
jgi:hypothetical protein